MIFVSSSVDPLRRRAVLQAMAAAGIAAAWPARALTAWPVRPVRLIIGGPPGSSPDELASTLVGPLAAALGQPVEIENRPGAGGQVAATALAREGDDHTLGLVSTSQLTVARLLNPVLGYDPLTDLVPVALVVTTPLVLCVSPRLAARGRAALRAVGAGGAAWRYGSPGMGSLFHLGMELLKGRTGWQTTHVPYPGNPQVINALLQGDVQLALLPPGLVLPHWRDGKLPAVAVTAGARSPLLPGVPTLAERGVADVQFEQWYALAAPRALHAAHAERAARAVARVLRDTRVQQPLLKQGWQAAGSTPAGLARRVAADFDQLRAVIERQQIRMP